MDTDTRVGEGTSWGGAPWGDIDTLIPKETHLLKRMGKVDNIDKLFFKVMLSKNIGILPYSAFEK